MCPGHTPSGGFTCVTSLRPLAFPVCGMLKQEDVCLLSGDLNLGLLPQASSQ